MKGFAAWKPHKATERLLEDIEEVLDEYREHLPMTIRQVFYRLVGKGYPKSEGFYGKVQETLNRARRCGRISFGDIRDDGVSRRGGEEVGYESPEHYYRTYEEISNFYRRNWHDDQPAFVQVLTEAAGMVPMIERAVRSYRVAVSSSSGFDSLTVKYGLYSDARQRWEISGQSTMFLHLGDHDPSGVALFESMAEDLDTFAADEGLDELVELRRVALTPFQIRSLGIATKPDEVKPTDSRSKSFIERGLEPAAQLEAIPPDMLSGIIRQAVEDALDLIVLTASRERELRERAVVQEKLDVVNDVLRDAFRLDREETT